MKLFRAKTTINTTRKIFYLSIAWAIIITATYVYAFLGLINQSEHTALLVGETENLTKEKVTLLTLRGQAVETTRARQELADYFIPKDGVVTFLNRIQDLGESGGVDLKVNSVLEEGEETSPEQFEYLKLSMSGSGNWTDVYRFESLMELMPYKVIVDSVRLEKIQSEVGSGLSRKKSTANLGWKVVLEIRILKLK